MNLPTISPRHIAVSAVKNGRILHIGVYADEETAKRVRENINDFCPGTGWEVWE